MYRQHRLREIGRRRGVSRDKNGRAGHICVWLWVGSPMGVTALLSACSLVRCCSHQFVFPCLEVLLQGTPPPCTISCKTLPGHTVDADSLHISCADIFISQVRAASGSPPQCQLTVEDVFWDATILHSVRNSACPLVRDK